MHSDGNRMGLMVAALVLMIAAAGAVAWKMNRNAGSAAGAERQARLIQQAPMNAAPVQQPNDLIPVGGLKAGK